MNRLLAALLLTLAMPYLASADSTAEVDALPFEEFKRISGLRRVSLDADAVAVILKCADGLDPGPFEITSVAGRLRDGRTSTRDGRPIISFSALVPLATLKDSQSVCANFVNHKDPLLRFVANVVLASNGDSKAAEVVHGLIHNQSFSLIDKRLLKTWCNGIGIRAQTDDANKILNHLTTARSKAPKLKTSELEELRREQKAITYLKDTGGFVSFPSEWFLSGFFSIPDGFVAGTKSWWEKPTDRWFGMRVRHVGFVDEEFVDLYPLANMKKLTKLELSGTWVNDLTPLTELRHLKYLRVEMSGGDLSPLAGLKSLEELYLSGSGVSDLSPLMELMNLKSLSLGYAQVRDLSPLAELENLRSLDLRSCRQVSDKQVQELRQALPNCEIRDH